MSAKLSYITLSDWTVLERSITQLPRQPSAEGGGAFIPPSCSEVTGRVPVCVKGAPGTPVEAACWHYCKTFLG